MIERDEERRDTRVVGVATVVGLGAVMMLVIWALAGGLVLAGFLALGAALMLPMLTCLLLSLLDLADFRRHPRRQGARQYDVDDPWFNDMWRG